MGAAEASTTFDTPTLIEAILRLGGFVLLFVVAAVAWFWWQRRIKAAGGRRKLEVLDRAFLARGASVALLRVEDRRVLVGVSPEGVRLLRSLDRSRPAPATEDPPPDANLFSRLYHRETSEASR